MDKIEITPALLSELKENAEKATPGPWENVICCSDDGVVYEIANPVLRQKAEENGVEDEVIWNIIKSNCFDDSPCGVLKKANATFIAAANPAVVLALIRRILELEKEIEARHKIIQEDDGRIEEAEGKCLLLKEKISRLEQENARLKAETAKDLAILEEEADWLATWCADACAYRRGRCDGCAFNEQSICYCEDSELPTTANYWRRAAGIAARENDNA